MSEGATGPDPAHGGTGEAGAGDGERGEEPVAVHLQAAARDLIGAARAMLDLAERVVDDPLAALAQLRSQQPAPGPPQPTVERIEVTEEARPGPDGDRDG